MVHDRDEDRRAGGASIRLSEGSTYCRREGPRNAVPIVLVHGATVPCWEFDELVPLLLGAGFQTLRFDLYGHGASDRLAGPYTFDRFARQVAEIVEAMAFSQPAIHLGHSFGAALVAAVAAARPERVQRLVLVAPMVDFVGTVSWSKLLHPPLMGEAFMRFVGVPALIRRRRQRFAMMGRPHLTSRFVEQAADGGFGRAILSMFRSGALGDMRSRYAALRSLDREILVITGDDDTVIPATHVALLRSLLPAHAHRAIPAGHSLLLTHPTPVVAALNEWMARPTTR
ncbi:alpha/beta hydrolase [Myxococcota bacterium]|nr:alpha/beta hydrolase [Myxococcota bacterium]